MHNQSLLFLEQKQELTALWELHRVADWPVSSIPCEGELMTLDTVVVGCLTYYFDEHSLDQQRVEILQDCLGDLEGLLLDLESEAKTYFERLKRLGELLLAIGRSSLPFS